MGGTPLGAGLRGPPRARARVRPSGRRHVIELLLLPSLPVARAEVNTPTSSGRALVFPLPSPQLGGRARLFSGPGLCPGFPPSRAGRQGGRRRANGQESSRKSVRQLFASLTEVRSAGRRGSRRELFAGRKVHLWVAEEMGRRLRRSLGLSSLKENFASSEHFGLEGGGPKPKLGENHAWG